MRKLKVEKVVHVKTIKPVSEEVVLTNNSPTIEHQIQVPKVPTIETIPVPKAKTVYKPPAPKIEVPRLRA